MTNLFEFLHMKLAKTSLRLIQTKSEIQLGNQKHPRRFIAPCPQYLDRI